MKSLVRIDDPSDHGGSMVSASGTVMVDGALMCLSGDLHSCPIKDHGVTAVTSFASLTSGGKSAIMTGDVAGCGAVITQGGSVTSG